MYFCRWDQVSIKRLIKLNNNINTLSNMIHDIYQEIFLFLTKSHVWCLPRERKIAVRQFANVSIVRQIENVSIFRQFDNVSDFFFFQICFDASSGQPHLQSIEFQIFFSYKIIPGIVNNTVNFDYKWNMPLSLKLPLCDYWI